MGATAAAQEEKGKMSRTNQNGPMVLSGRTTVQEPKEETAPCPGGERPGDEGDSRRGQGWCSGWANKAELSDTVAERLGISRKRAMRTVNAVLRVITDLLREKRKVAVKGFGTFESRTRKGRAYKHPKTGESVEVPDKGTVVFKPSKNLLIRVHGPEGGRIHPELILD